MKMRVRFLPTAWCDGFDGRAGARDQIKREAKPFGYPT